MPRRILAIRLQAMGDLVITLPYLQQLRNSLPANTRIDLLTRHEVMDIPRTLDLFDSVFVIGGGRNTKKQLLSTALLYPRLLARRYQVVLDLQDNIISRLVRKCLLPRAWSQFDRFSPIAAGESTRLTIEAAGLGPSSLAANFQLRSQGKPDPLGHELLAANGWDRKSCLIVLNPAGAFPTRNWPLENYLAFVRQWLNWQPHTQFLLLGTSFIAAQAAYLKNSLGATLIDLTGKTTPAQAFIILQSVGLTLSEDSGLMHMSWVSGIPTIALFGSTRSDRARPLGAHSILLGSADLPCGNCMLRTCPQADIPPCLNRYSPSLIFQQARQLLAASDHRKIIGKSSLVQPVNKMHME